LLDKAVRLAAAAPDDNPVRRNTRRVEQALRAQGVEETTARAAAGTRVFGPAPGAFGAGISGMMESSRDQGDQKAVGEAYMRNMGYGYGDGVWGKNVNGNLREQLRDNEGVIHSRSTNLYGVLDNDETYQFAGGLAAATTASGGREPRIMISNVRKPGEERMEDMKQFVTRELSSRLWNPKWIEGMKKSGYSGAREMASEVEHLYGLRSTAPSTVDESVWQETFDVYIADKNRLGLKEYFAKENPHARQVLTARLLEVDRQGIYRFTETDRKALVRTYIESVNRDGISCYSNACDNRRLASYVLKQAPGAVSRAAFEEWTNRMTAATTAPRSGRPVTASAKQPFVVARRSLRIFEISNGRIHIVGHDVDWKWVPLSAIALLLGSCLSAAVLRRRAGSYIVLALADGGGDSASMVSTTLRR
jgi:cobaltochelatase CobN